MRHHADDPIDELRPLADFSEPFRPTLPPSVRPLPETVRTDQLTTPDVLGSKYASTYRQEWVRTKVAANCIAGPNPVIRVAHHPHILEQRGGSEDVVVDAPATAVLKRRKLPVVEIWIHRNSKARHGL
jgi:hypothetical protein